MAESDKKNWKNTIELLRDVVAEGEFLSREYPSNKEGVEMVELSKQILARQEKIDAALGKLVEVVQREIAWLREESPAPNVAELETALAELKEAQK